MYEVILVEEHFSTPKSSFRVMKTKTIDRYDKILHYNGYIFIKKIVADMLMDCLGCDDISNLHNKLSKHIKFTHKIKLTFTGKPTVTTLLKKYNGLVAIGFEIPVNFKLGSKHRVIKGGYPVYHVFNDITIELAYGIENYLESRNVCLS